MDLLLFMLVSVLVVGFGSLFVVIKMDKILRKKELVFEENKKSFQELKN